MKKKIFIALFFALLIRLISLNQSLWLDEAVTAKVVMSYKTTDIISKFSPTDFHPPIYYLFMKLWTNTFGYSEISLRMPSIIFSLLTGYLVYLLGKKIKDKETGFWAMIFFLFNPLIVYYSQEARMYMMVTFLLTISYFYLHKILNTKYSILDTLFFNLFIMLSFLTFYGSIFLITTVFIYLIIRKQYKTAITSLTCFLIACFIISPLLLKQLENSKIILQAAVNWKSILGVLNLKNILLIPLKFSIGRITVSPKIVSWLWCVAIFYFIFKGSLKNKDISFMFIFPICLGVFFSIYTPLLQYFRFIYLIPFMSLLLIFGLIQNPNKHYLLFGFFFFSFMYIFNNGFHREDWRSLVTSLPKDKKIFTMDNSLDPLRYYLPSIKTENLFSIKNNMVSNEEIIVIPYVADIYGFDYKKILISQNYKILDTKNFRGTSYEKWVVGP